MVSAHVVTCQRCYGPAAAWSGAFLLHNVCLQQRTCFAVCRPGCAGLAVHMLCCAPVRVFAFGILLGVCILLPASDKASPTVAQALQCTRLMHTALTALAMPTLCAHACMPGPCQEYVRHMCVGAREVLAALTALTILRFSIGLNRRGGDTLFCTFMSRVSMRQECWRPCASPSSCRAQADSD